jgi:hypothetical protein
VTFVDFPSHVYSLHVLQRYVHTCLVVLIGPFNTDEVAFPNRETSPEVPPMNLCLVPLALAFRKEGANLTKSGIQLPRRIHRKYDIMILKNTGFRGTAAMPFVISFPSCPAGTTSNSIDR